VEPNNQVQVTAALLAQTATVLDEPTRMAPLSRLEIIKKKKEVIKALGSTFKERFKLTIPTDGAFTWIKGSQYNHGIVLRITPTASKSTNYLIAELSLDQPFTVTYMLVKVTRVPQGRGAYIDEETSREELTISGIVQHQKDGGELQSPIDKAARDPVNAERNLSILVRWYYMCRGLADVTNGDSKAFALQLKATTKAISVLGVPERLERRSRARALTHRSALSLEELGENSNSRARKDIQHSDAQASGLDVSSTQQSLSDVGVKPALSLIVQDLPGLRPNATQELVEQDPVECIPHTDIHKSKEGLDIDDNLGLARTFAGKTQDDPAITTVSHATPATTKASLRIPRPTKILCSPANKSILQTMPTPTPTPTPTLTTMVVPSRSSRHAETPDYSSHNLVPRTTPAIREISLQRSRPADYSEEDLLPTGRSVIEVPATSTLITLDDRILLSVLERTLKEKNLLRYSKDVIKNITMAKFTHKSYMPLAIRLGDDGTQKGIFACLTLDPRNPQVDIVFEDRRGEDLRKVEISMPKRVQKALGRPFNQAISWGILPGGRQDGGDRVRLFCKYVFASKGYVSWDAFKTDDVEEVMRVLAFMRANEPDFSRPIGALSDAADDNLEYLVPSSSAGATHRCKRRKQREERVLPAFEPLDTSFMYYTQRTFTDSAIASARSSTTSGPTESPAARAQEYRTAQVARQIDANVSQTSNSAVGFGGTGEVEASRSVVSINDRGSRLRTGPPTIRGSSLVDTDGVTLHDRKRSAIEPELQDIHRLNDRRMQ